MNALIITLWLLLLTITGLRVSEHYATKRHNYVVSYFYAVPNGGFTVGHMNLSWSNQTSQQQIQQYVLDTFLAERKAMGLTTTGIQTTPAIISITRVTWTP